MTSWIHVTECKWSLDNWRCKDYRWFYGRIRTRGEHSCSFRNARRMVYSGSSYDASSFSLWSSSVFLNKVSGYNMYILPLILDKYHDYGTLPDFSCFKQITETSLRVLSYISSSRMLRAEWTPPVSTPPAPGTDSSRRTKIHHATLTSDGAVLATRETVYSVQVDGLGVPHTVSAVERPHQVFLFSCIRFFSLLHWTSK